MSEPNEKTSHIKDAAKAITGAVKKTPPKLRQHKTGQYMVTYRKKDHYLGHNKELAEQKYLAFMRDVWLVEETKSLNERGRMSTLTVPDALHPVADSLREYSAWSFPVCVYFLIHSSKVTYVGKTNSLQKRIEEHMRLGKVFDRVLWMPVDERLAETIEARFIRDLKPRDNIRGTGD